MPAQARRVVPRAGSTGRLRRRAARCRVPAAGVLAAALALVLVHPAAAQTTPGGRAAETLVQGNRLQAPRQMLVTADEMHYDYQNDRVSAVGNVQLYHDGAVLEADKVTYDRKANKVFAEGQVRLRQKSGDVVYADRLELSQDFTEGFIDSLRLEGADKTRFAAASATRRDGDVTVLRSGIYTACEPCKDDPKKPPLWQVKAARIIHREGERMIYFENASLEFFGLPIAWFPYMSAPDPTVRRKTGVLMPRVIFNDRIGVGAEVPFFWAIAPNYDITISPTPTTRQGLLMQGEWRHRLINGAYLVRASGIFQEDRDAFAGEPGDRDQRGAIESSGLFWLNERWQWGWDGVLLSDRTFLRDYDLSRGLLAKTDTKSQVFLVGQGNRSYFDARTVYYMGLTVYDRQKEFPFVHPVVDYDYTFLPAVLGGELKFNANLTSLSRTDADFDSRTGVYCSSLSPETVNSFDCLMRGAPGSYTRLSADMQWRRSFIEARTGQVITPFAMVRGDSAWRDVTDRPYNAGFISDSNDVIFRGMAAAGLEYRWPFISVQPWGTQTIEPIAQVIVRPNETRIGDLPNEDAQSLVFDDANLFRIDKFSGYDRIEGGGRANVGVQYNAHFTNGGHVNALFGQSYHLFGLNSFTQGDMASTGLDSGLDQRASDYVARLYYKPNQIFSGATRYRFGQDDFSVKRFEVEATASFSRTSVSATYGRYDPQPALGYIFPREAVVGSGTVRLTDNWSISASAIYDIELDKLNATSYGLSYLDECFGISVRYTTTFAGTAGGDNVHTVMLRLQLRTLGESGFSTTLGEDGGQNSAVRNMLQ